MRADNERLQSYCSVEVAAHLAGLSVPRVRGLVRSDLVQPALVERSQPLFGQVELVRLRKIRRLCLTWESTRPVWKSSCI
jgi:hypothetical protein